jgi:hypothetical protein
MNGYGFAWTKNMMRFGAAILLKKMVARWSYNGLFRADHLAPSRISFEIQRFSWTTSAPESACKSIPGHGSLKYAVSYPTDGCLLYCLV